MTTQSMSLTVHRSNLLTSNQRRHYHDTGRATKVLRITGKLNAQSQELRPMTRVHVHVFVGWPDRRRRDVPNLWPTVKALIDGIVDAGILPDDNDDVVTALTFRRSGELHAAKDTVAITIALEETP